jgi:hypothetical protein
MRVGEGLEIVALIGAELTTEPDRESLSTISRALPR